MPPARTDGLRVAGAMKRFGSGCCAAEQAASIR